MTIARVALLLPLLAACAGHTSQAYRVVPLTPHPPALLSTDSADELVRGGHATVVDIRTEVQVYLRDHLPGAVYLNTETLRAADHGVPNLLLPAESYRLLFSRLGIGFDRPVVIYSAGESRNVDATYLAWILQGFGHPAVYVLDGGYGKWQAENRPLTRRYPLVEPADLSKRPFTPERATLEDVKAALGQAGTVLVDARAPDQYAGEAGAQMRRGHIPGAVNHYWQDDLERNAFAKVWRDRERLRAEYAAQGITPDKDIITYCNGGLESSHVYFTLRFLLGYPRVRIYDGSWTEWAEREELPIATGDRP